MRQHPRIPRLQPTGVRQIHDYLLLRNPNVTQDEIDTMCNLNGWYAELVDFIYAHEGIDK